MKTNLSILILAVSQLLAFNTSHASPASRENMTRDCGPAFFQEVRELIQNCTDNNRVKTSCRAVKVVGSDVFFILKSQNFVAHVKESPDADGGDLNDVYIEGRLRGGKTCKAELHNVLSFSEPLRALGGN